MAGHKYSVLRSTFLFNQYFIIGLTEDQVDLIRVLNIKQDYAVKNRLDTFRIQIVEVSELRNSFAHRYTPNQADYRSFFVNTSDGSTKLGLGWGKVYSPFSVVKKSIIAVNLLARLMTDLVEQMPQDY